MGDLTHFLNKYLKNYDTIVANYDTKNLYKVKNVYYYRKKINYKLYRISLNTKSIKIALQRKKIFDKMGVEELMFTIESGDYKYIFEYETNEELESHSFSISNSTIPKIITIAPTTFAPKKIKFNIFIALNVAFSISRLSPKAKVETNNMNKITIILIF